MNTLQRNTGYPANDLDGLLQSYFRAEMPNHFPPLQPWNAAPDTLPFVPPLQQRWQGWTRVRSRLALAASVAILAVGGWIISSGSSPYVVPTVTDGGSGSAHRILPHQLPKPKPDLAPEKGKTTLPPGM